MTIIVNPHNREEVETYLEMKTKTTRTSTSRGQYDPLRSMTKDQFLRLRPTIRKLNSQRKNPGARWIEAPIFNAISSMEKPDNLYHWENWQACVRFYEKKF